MGGEFLNEILERVGGPERPLCEAVVVGSTLQWKRQAVGDSGAMIYLPRNAAYREWV